MSLDNVVTVVNGNFCSHSFDMRTLSSFSEVGFDKELAQVNLRPRHLELSKVKAINHTIKKKRPPVLITILILFTSVSEHVKISPY
jgi:hypothetical protein